MVHKGEWGRNAVHIGEWGGMRCIKESGEECGA